MSDLVRWLHYFNASVPTGKGRAQLCLTQSFSAHRNESLVIQSSQVQLPSPILETKSVWAFAKIKIKYMTKWFFPAFYPPHLVSFRVKSYRKKCKEKYIGRLKCFSSVPTQLHPKWRAEITKTHQTHSNSHFYTPHIEKFLEHLPDSPNSLLSNGYELSNLSDIDKQFFIDSKMMSQDYWS